MYILDENKIKYFIHINDVFQIVNVVFNKYIIHRIEIYCFTVHRNILYTQNIAIEMQGLKKMGLINLPNGPDFDTWASSLSLGHNLINCIHYLISNYIRIDIN